MVRTVWTGHLALQAQMEPQALQAFQELVGQTVQAEPQDLTVWTG
jgi:hypothetical protein